MRRAARQRGFLLIAAVVIIVAAGIMALVIVTLVAGGAGAGAQQLRSTQALFIAESGLERGTHQWGLDNTYPGEGPIGFGGGAYTITSFDTDSSGATLPAGRNRLRSVGTIGSSPPAERTVEAVVTHDLFVEPFPSFDWPTELLTETGGATGFDSSINCPGTTCPDTLAGSGSMVAQTTAPGPNDQLTGYRERTLTRNIVTGPGMSVDVEVGYEKITGNNPRASEISIVLVDTADIETVIWSNTDPTTGGWLLGTATAVALPPGRTFDRIRLRFDLWERGNNQISVWFDEIRIKTSGGAVIREAWREVFP